MASEWIQTTLGELCIQQDGSIQTGPFGSQLHASDYSETGTPVVMPINLVAGNISEQGIARVGDEHVAKLSKHKLKPGDIVFSRRGDVTRFALVSDRESGWLCGTGCLKISLGKPAMAVPQFIAGVLSLPETREWLVQHAVGATMPNLNTGILAAIPVRLPALETQKQVAGLLDAMKSRIDNLRQTNTTLEAIAQALFKSWFVDFDPVRAKAEGREPEGMDAATAALFPSEFEDSELGPIPQGWRVGGLGDHCDNIRKQAKPETLDANTPYIGLEHMPRRCIALAEWDSADGLASGKFWYQPGDVLFGKLRPYFHKVGVAPHEGVCSTDILVIRARSPVWFGFTAMHLSSDPLVSYATQLSNGAKMPRTNWRDLAAYKVAIPDERCASAFNDVIAPIIDRIQASVGVMRTLAELRDTLLPRLISGKLRLPEAEAEIEALA